MLPPLQAWHDYFSLLGTAAATLVGAMFVVVSIGIGILTRERGRAIRAFLTTTVAHLSAVLLGAALTMVPLDWPWLAGVAGVAGIVGLVYSAHIALGFGEHPGTDRSDWFWYAVFPPLGYALLAAAGIAAWWSTPASVDLLAAAVALLLVAGIRNAWDMIVFLVTQARTPG